MGIKTKEDLLKIEYKNVAFRNQLSLRGYIQKLCGR